jgi:hypothetical protein
MLLTLLFPNLFFFAQFAQGVREHGAGGTGDSYSCEQKIFIMRNVMMSTARMRLAGHMARMSERRYASRFCGGGGDVNF